MNDHRKVKTTAEVWAVIRARHHDELVVFGTYSHPDEGEMYTEYGFQDASVPLIAARTTWHIRPDRPRHERYDEKHEYWLFYALEGGE